MIPENHFETAPLLFRIVIPKHRLLQRLARKMSGTGFRIASPVAQNQQGDRFEARGDCKCVAHFVGVPRHDPDGAQSQLRRLHHHVRRYNAGIDVPAGLSIARPHPAFCLVTADQQRRCKRELTVRHFLQLRNTRRAGQHQNPLRLIVAGRGRKLPGSQDIGQLLLFDRPRIKLQHGKPLRSKVQKVHSNCLLTRFYPALVAYMAIWSYSAYQLVQAFAVTQMHARPPGVSP